MGVCDEKGRYIFSIDNSTDRVSLRKKNGDVIKRVFDFIILLSGMGDAEIYEEEEDQKKTGSEKSVLA